MNYTVYDSHQFSPNRLLQLLPCGKTECHWSVQWLFMWPRVFEIRFTIARKSWRELFDHVGQWKNSPNRVLKEGESLVSK